jgi:hypothetical protein
VVNDRHWVESGTAAFGASRWKAAQASAKTTVMPRMPLILAATAILAGCDQMRFVVENDTNGPVKIAHRFNRPDASCHTPEFMAATSTIAAKYNFPFGCSASEIAYIELSQAGRSCRVDRVDLISMGRELKASICFDNVRFSKDPYAL